MKRSQRIIVAALIFSVLGGAAASANVTYTYDALGRIVTATYDNGTVVQYTYDAADNRLSQVVTNTGTTLWGSFTWGDANWAP